MPASVLALVREAAPPDRMIRDERAGDAPSSRRGRSRAPASRRRVTRASRSGDQWAGRERPEPLRDGSGSRRATVRSVDSGLGHLDHRGGQGHELRLGQTRSPDAVRVRRARSYVHDEDAR
jgi:hypothetical protein